MADSSFDSKTEMHSSDFDYEEPIEKRFEDLCQELCIEGTIREEAWEKYKDVWSNYSIDGDQVQWLVCSLYECCRRSLSDAYSGHSVDNAYVSLSRLLSAAKMSMVQFFHRIRKWADMTDMLDDMRDRVELLERQFAVSSVIFRNFGRSFGVLFSETQFDHSQIQPNATDLFRFTWLVFIKSRASFPAVTDDLVNSYHLLACCLDWVLGVVMVSRRSDLINMELNGLPRDFVAAVAQNKNWCTPHDDPPCMLRPICEDNDVNYVECKTVKEHFFRPFIQKLIDKELIKIHPSMYGSLLEWENFETTLQNLNNNYEEYIIGTGDFDERIYLSPNAAEEIGSIGDSRTPSDLSMSASLTQSIRRSILEINNSGFGGFTETTRRGNANAGAIGRLNGGVNFNNPEARSQNLNQLQIMLAGRSKEPNEALVSLIEAHCSNSPMNTIRARLTTLSDEFVQAYSDQKPSMSASSNGETAGSDGTNKIAGPAAQQRLQLCIPLYYLALENILVDEIRKIERRLNSVSAAGGGDSITTGGQLRRIKPDLTILLSQDVFHRSLFACCMEIVLLSCDPPTRHFPWILDAFCLESVHLFKVVEVVIRNLDLPRDIVKYLNQVVEHILDSYAWRSQSPIWAILKASGRAPSIEEVIPPEKLDQGPGSNFPRTSDLSSSTESKPVLTSSLGPEIVLKQSPGFGKQSRLMSSNSPTSRNVVREFPLGSTSRRRLLSSGAEDESAQAAAQLLASGSEDPDPGANNALVDPNLLTVTSEEVTMSTVQDSSSMDVKPIIGHLSENYPDSSGAGSGWPATSSATTTAANMMNLSSYTGSHDSLAIFFRQVYQIASLRVRDLCDRLNLNRDLMAKIWTCLEQVVVHETFLLRDRCLDQVILCCLYGVCKLALYRPLTFVDIVQVYRMQPQSTKDIYRRVLINRVSYGHGSTEERGDLSRFYNTIFLPQMKEFIKKAAAVRSTPIHDTPIPSTGNNQGTDETSMVQQWIPHPSLSPMPAKLNSSTLSSSGTGGLGLGTSVNATDVAQARRLASNRNIFISPVKQQVNLSPKKVVFTIGRSSSKDLQDVNMMISSAERRASMANLTMGLKRPGNPNVTFGTAIGGSPAFTVTSSANTPRTVTLVGPSGFQTKRMDYEL